MSPRARDALITALLITSLTVFALDSPLKDVPNHTLSFLLFLSVFAHWLEKVYAQVYARAVWWIFTLIGIPVFIMSMIPADLSDGFLHLMKWSTLKWGIMALGPAGALLVSGRSRLIQESSWFNPHANRWPLTLSMILGCADVILLLVLAAIGFTHSMSDWHHGPLALGSMIATLTMIAGLYRMKVWGAFGMLAVNILVAALGFGGAFVGYPEVVGGLFFLTTIIQTLLAGRLTTLIKTQAQAPMNASHLSTIRAREEEVEFDFLTDTRLASDEERVQHDHAHISAS